MTVRKTILATVLAAVAAGCIENTSYVTQERSDKVAQYILKKAPTVQHPAKVDLEGKVILLGYDLKASNPRPGGQIEVTWYWEVKREVGPGWRLFTHCIGDGDEKFNRDAAGPMRQSFQPEHWRPGQIIKDVQPIKIPKDWSSEKLSVRTGIWKGAARLKGKSGMDSGNRIIGPEVKVAVKPPKPPMQIAYAKIAPKIDGEIENDAAWKAATPLGVFVNTMKGTAVRERTQVKLMWDENFLYVAFDAQDTDLKTQYEKHDDELWHEDAFEIFIDPLGDRKDYYELQVSPKGVVFDSYLPKYRKNKNEWSSNMKVVVRTDGTVNDHDDTDKGWRGEIAVPFKEMQKGGGIPPKKGDIWALNFFRIDASEDKKTSYSGWSPPMRGDFHTLSKFRRIEFEKNVEAPPSAAVPSHVDAAKVVPVPTDKSSNLKSSAAP